jgi:hypothetical protein
MDGWRRVHRILAVLFLLTIPPAAYYSFNSDPAAPHPAVYGPLFPLAVMIITGTWLLVRPGSSRGARESHRDVMRRISTSIDIAAPSSRVWEVLMNFPAYSDWNPFIRQIAGSTNPGSKLQLTVQPEGGSAMSFVPEVLVCMPEREFRWRGRVLFKGVFDGEHALKLTESTAAACTFAQEETFSGVLVPLIMRGAMLAGTEAGFEAMNRALKARAEHGKS